ncbi:MAG: HK97-fold major capsid protein [Armatimonadota bacterium]
MKTAQINIHSQEYMETMARLMSEALESPDGMRALAAAIASPIEQEISRKEITSLLLTQHTLPKGERPIYQKKPKVKAYWISTEGEAREQELGQDEVEFPTNRIHSTPMVDVSVLKNGNIGTLMDIQTSAADEIRKEIDRRTLTILSAAVPAANTIEVTGGKLTDDALNEAISIIEDLELSVKYIVMRGRRFNDMRDWDLDPETRAELRTKGVIKNYGTGGILLTASASMTEILLIPDDEIGKMPIRESLKTEAIEQKTRFKTGWLVWTELGQGITRPEILAKIKILA